MNEEPKDRHQKAIGTLKQCAGMYKDEPVIDQRITELTLKSKRRLESIGPAGEEPV